MAVVVRKRNVFQISIFFGILTYSNGDAYPYQCIREIKEEYTLPTLPYGYGDLEPYIDEATVKVHHTGHHAAYTKKMNVALQQWRNDPVEGKNTNHLAEKSILDILKEIEEVPQKYRKALTNNGGGFVNHNIYWSVMSPNPENKERLPGEPLLSDINKNFGNFSQFVDIFTKDALALFGSGYVWLSRNPLDGNKLLVSTTANQDSPISQSFQPILVLDVWEHAYYLKYQNRRPDHISEWWKIVDWNVVEKLDNWWKDIPQHDEF